MAITYECEFCLKPCLNDACGICDILYFTSSHELNCHIDVVRKREPHPFICNSCLYSLALERDSTSIKYPGNNNKIVGYSIYEIAQEIYPKI